MVLRRGHIKFTKYGGGTTMSKKCLGIGCPQMQWPPCELDIPCCKCELGNLCNSWQPCPAEGGEK